MRLDPSTEVTIRTAKQRMSFSAAHFLVHADAWEPLHGHNFQLAVTVTGSVGSRGYVIDFGLLKRLTKRVCETYDRRILIPGDNESVQLEDSGGELTVRLGDSRYVFPTREALVLRLTNTSVEQLALLLLETLAPKIMRLSPAVDRVEVELEESVGQSATAGMDRGELSESATVVDWPDGDADDHSARTSADHALLSEAVRLSHQASGEGESPFGAVVAIGGTQIATGMNRTTSSGDPTRHAELEAIADASTVGDLSGAVLYSSCEPCPMCLFGAYYAGIRRVVYGASLEQALALESGDPDVASSDINALANLGIELVQTPEDQQEAIRALQTHVDRHGHL